MDERKISKLIQKTMTPLETIEQITSDDFCYELEGNFPQGLHEIRKALKEARKKLMQIYKISHCANGRCENPHLNWK